MEGTVRWREAGTSYPFTLSGRIEGRVEVETSRERTLTLALPPSFGRLQPYVDLADKDKIRASEAAAAYEVRCISRVSVRCARRTNETKLLTPLFLPSSLPSSPTNSPLASPFISHPASHSRRTSPSLPSNPHSSPPSRSHARLAHSVSFLDAQAGGGGAAKPSSKAKPASKKKEVAKEESEEDDASDDE